MRLKGFSPCFWFANDSELHACLQIFAKFSRNRNQVLFLGLFLLLEILFYFCHDMPWDSTMTLLLMFEPPLSSEGEQKLK